MSTETLTGQQIADANLDGWTLFSYYGLWRLHTRIHTRTFANGRRVVNAIGDAAEQLDHPVDLDLRSNRVNVRLTSGYEVGGITQEHVDLARTIVGIAADAGAELECQSSTLRR